MTLYIVDLERWMKLQEQAQSWEKRFTELARARNTAPEESLELFRAEAEQRIESECSIISLPPMSILSSVPSPSPALQQENEHLRAQMPHFSDLSDTGGRSMITLLTEEGTNTRIRQYAEQIRDLKSAVADRDSALAESKRQLEACQIERKPISKIALSRRQSLGVHFHCAPFLF